MMAVNPEIFSELTNSLQRAALLSEHRVRQARADEAEAMELHAAIVRAIDAVRRLRENGEERQS